MVAVGGENRSRESASCCLQVCAHRQAAGDQLLGAERAAAGRLFARRVARLHRATRRRSRRDADRIGGRHPADRRLLHSRRAENGERRRAASLLYTAIS